MNYYPDDIIEVLNLTSDDIAEIKSQRCNFNIDPVKEAVGARFRCNKYTCSDQVFVDGWCIGGYVNITGKSLNIEQVRLYRRTFKNKIKNLFNKLKKSQS